MYRETGYTIMTTESFLERTIKRREFLTYCGTGILTASLAACQGAPADSGVKASPTPGPSPSPTRLPQPTGADWSTLSKSLHGTLVRPDSPQYAAARQLFDPRFDSTRPAAIAYCASPTDVQFCLAFARRFNLPLAPRSGGHSAAGYSTTTGLVLDVTRMHAVALDPNAGTVTIGAGARLIDVYSALAQHGLTIPAGSCPTVGIAGLALGGGAGVLSRKFGLTCDNVVAAQVVVADGRVLTCDASHEPELFWALRGGGGGNFGVVTSFTLRTHRVDTLALFTLQWPWNSAATVIDAWQNWAPQAPDEVWSNCLLLATRNKGTEPVIQVNGVYVGDVSALNPILLQLTNRIGVAPRYRYVSDAGLLDTMLYEGGCFGKTVDACHLPSQNPNGQLLRDTSAVKSDYFTHTLPRPGIDALVNAISARQASSTLGEGGIGMDSYGGAINRVAADATAFVHRDPLFSVQYSTSWNAADPASIVAANRKWRNDLWQAMRPHASGFAYQNYMDPDLADWQHAYYGANLPRLQHVKATYDPANLFHFKQGIPPA
ncbi:MAG: FAD-binding oxidoreductase [Ktedonobacteraceae bacterium]|nr:FAD-binding oxidoreductase [Ktedonobacteraceae bacterium]